MTKRTVIAFVFAILFFVAYEIWVLPHFLPPPPAVEFGSTESSLGASASTESYLAGEALPGPAAGMSTSSALEAAGPSAQAPGSTTPAAVTPGSMTPAGGFPVPAAYLAENVDKSDFTAATDLLTVTFTPRTGSIKSVTLNKFNNFQRTGKLVLLTDFTEGQYPTEITSVAGEDTSGVYYVRVAPATTLATNKLDTAVAFETILPSGVKITKRYTLFDGKYGVGLEVRVENLAAEKRDISYELVGPAGIPPEAYQAYGTNIQAILAHVAPGAGDKMSLAYLPAWDVLSKGDLQTQPGGRTLFAGAVNQYFVAVLKPDQAVPVVKSICYAVEDTAAAKSVFGDRPPRDAVKGLPPAAATESLRSVYFSAGSKMEVGKVELAAAGAQGSSVTHAFLLFSGPRDKGTLAGFDTPASSTGFPALVDYGWFDWFVKIILYLMKLFHSVIPNWGVAIILLTFLIRVLMHPLTKKSQVSMTKMARLQPEIKKLQEKYKNDKQKLGAEQMKLMKERGANPMGGCLPMLIQMPVLIALYKALGVSIELRQAPFVFWIKDLALPDRLIPDTIHVAFRLPLLGSELNLLPLLMLGAMIWQTKTSPQAATPEAAQQQKIMTILMPIFIGVLFYSVASGLNLYFLVSTLFGIAEQWVIRRHIAAQEAGAQD